MRHALLRVRKISQGIFLALFVYILWSTTYPLTGMVAPETFFLFDPLLMVTTALSERVVLPGLVWSAVMCALGVLLGRFFCGWICPLGSSIDAVGACRRRDRSAPRVLKYFILGGIVLSAVAGIQLAWIFDPVVLAARFVSLNLIPTLTLVIDTGLTVLIRSFRLYGPVYDFYNMLRNNLLGVSAAYVAHAAVMFLGFVLVVGSSLWAARWWCRVLCPLGAWYGVLSRGALLRRTVDGCLFCGHCRPVCPTGAIRPDMSYDPAECILCMACVYACPAQRTRFVFGRRRQPRPSAERAGISRRGLLVLLAGAAGAVWGGRAFRRNGVRANEIIIRPPGALVEEEFLNRCIRCGNCMKVCPTNALQPLFFYPSLDAIWTPQLAPEIGYCEYHCNQCGAVCPTGAIPRLDITRKQQLRLGTAKIDRHLCLPYAKKVSCLVCEEHCPIPRKAIKIDRVSVDGKQLLRPVVDERLCIGCGICQHKCPVRPVRAIKVFSFASDRTAI